MTLNLILSNFLENSREEKRSKKINDQNSIVTNELEEVNLKCDHLNKVCECLEADFKFQKLMH